MAGWYTPVKGKCTWWRESIDEDDEHDMRKKDADKRWHCICGVEGRGWTFVHAELPADCPEAYRCRYYIKQG
jgi:hypothetical protein